MPKKLTNQDFINGCIKVHGDTYDLSRVQYINAKTKVKVICPTHGLFETRAHAFKKGTGCPACGRERTEASTRRTFDDFIAQAAATHNGYYSYPQQEYKGSSYKVKVECPRHGTFIQQAYKHVSGQGCPKCGDEVRGKGVSRAAANRFEQEANMVHANFYSYEKSKYSGAQEKVTITCPTHGDFQQTPNNHLRGKGCPECGKAKQMSSRPSTYNVSREASQEKTQAFVARAKRVHGKRYGYSKTKYIVSDESVIITCSEHGDFFQTPDSHIQGRGCRECAALARRPTFKTQDEFEAEANAAHNGKYTYGQYLSASLPITIFCTDHGAFEQLPSNHLSGTGCPACWEHRQKYDNPRKRTTEECIEKFRLVHGDKYDYSRVSYDGQKTNVEIICPKHGSFFQAPLNHYNNHQGCPRCATRISQGEQELADFLDSLGLDVEQQFKLDGFATDIRVGNVIIEYLGNYWHSTAVMTRQEAQAQGKTRRLLCNRNGFQYIAIYEDEWIVTKKRTKQYLRNVFGKAPTSGARKYTVGDITTAEARDFYQVNHLLGGANVSGQHKALLDASGKIAACMTLISATEDRGRANPRRSLSRFCTDGRSIAGAATRLFKAFDYDGEIVSYVDLDKFSGDVYERLGFVVDHEIEPDYWTLWPPLERKHKTATKRSNLTKLDGFDPTLTEYENTQNLGLYRIYHSGRLCVVRS